MNIDKTLFSSNVHPLLDLLASDEWPKAAPDFIICDDQKEDDKKERAEGILNWLDYDLKDKKFLDFGCGEGHVATEAKKRGADATGYDIVKSGNLAWEDGLLTTDFSKIFDQNFDIIFLYDTLDHCEDPSAALKQVMSVSTEKTKIFVRFHSWMSRHGSHLYQEINKAWVHLFFTEEELKKLGANIKFVQKYYTPLITQKKWILENGFKITYEDITKCVVEPFFKKIESEEFLKIKKEIKKFPDWQMSQTFNDYEIKIK
jgi:2-polyprenyl-3-methyl-5-hydroxy-6-metoxy-1,4-benzoquinol methylase